MRKTKIAIIGTAGIPAKYQGFEALAANLVSDLGNQWNLSVYCSGRQYKKPLRVKTYKNARLIYLPFQADGLQGIVYDAISMVHALFYAEVLLILGISGSFLIPLIRLFTNKKVITSVDGHEWKSSKWGKAAMPYRFIGEWIAGKFSHVHIANKESMQDHTALRYDQTTTTRTQPDQALLSKYALAGKPYAFKHCCIAPDHNIGMILSSFVQTPQHQLVISGNWNRTEYGRDLRKSYAIFPNISMLDPIDDQQELDLLRSNSFAYIHGDQPGGIDPGLLEAMFMGLPVLSLATTDNRATTEGKALYFSSATELASLLNHTRIGEFSNTGKAMREIAQRRYTWQMVAAKYEYLFMQTLKKGKEEREPVYQIKEKLPVLSFDMGF